VHNLNSFDVPLFLPRIDTSNEMISMAGAISGHNQAINQAMARYIELLKKFMPSRSRAGNFETQPNHLFGSTSTQVSYRVANAGE
jgi:hypothetical protein